MMLEKSILRNVGISLPPFSYWTRLLGCIIIVSITYTPTGKRIVEAVLARAIEASRTVLTFIKLCVGMFS